MAKNKKSGTSGCVVAALILTVGAVVLVVCVVVGIVAFAAHQVSNMTPEERAEMQQRAEEARQARASEESEPRTSERSDQNDSREGRETARDSPLSRTGSKWYEGGTLHESTIAEWRAASYRDRLATAADLAIVMQQNRGIEFKSLDELKPYAIELEVCISTAAAGGDADHEQVSAVSAMCFILMYE